MQEDFGLQVEEKSPVSSPRQETLREEYPPSSSPPFSLNLSSLDRRDALPEQDELGRSYIEVEESVEEGSMETKEDAVEVSVTEEVKEAPKEREETFSEVEEVVPEEESRNWKVGALEELAEAIIGWRRPKDKKRLKQVCTLCEEGTEDFKYGPIQHMDTRAALEELAKKLLEWKKPDEALGVQKIRANGYNSLAEERHLAMKYHGLDVEYSDVECRE